MYESFFGLREKPFNVTPDPHFLYLGEDHREALAQLLYGVKEKKGFIVVTGEVGTGKTTLLHTVLARLNGNSHTKTAFLFNPKLDAGDFIHYILKDLGVKVEGGSKGDHLHLLHEYLLAAYQKDENVVLIVDEAQGLNKELLEEIRLLSNLETSKSKLLQIVLVGQPELDKTLSQPGFRQLRQRINMQHRLSPLSLRETQEYVEKRLKVAGAKSPVFTKKALREIHRWSQGVPRLINILCDNALLSGYALDQKTVDRKLLKEAAKDLKLARRGPRVWIGFILVICLLVGSLLLVSGLDRMNDASQVYDGLLKSLQYLKKMAEEGLSDLRRFFSLRLALRALRLLTW